MSADDLYPDEPSDGPGAASPNRGPSGHEDRQELARLNALHDDLLEAVETAINPSVRADLAAELRSVRERIAELSMPPDGLDQAFLQNQTADSTPPTVDGPPAESGTGPFSQDFLPPLISTNGSQVEGSPGGPDHSEGGGWDRPVERWEPGQDPLPAVSPHGYGAGDEADGAEGDLAASAVWDPPPDSGSAISPTTPASLRGSIDRSRTPVLASRSQFPLMLALAAGLLLVAFIGINALTGGDDDETASAADGADPTEPAGPAAEAAAAAGAVGEIQAVAEAMGLGSIEVREVDGSIILAGEVSTEAERQAVIGAAEALAEGRSVDGSGLAVTGPSSVPEQTTPAAAALQRELDRILAATPIVFDKGLVAVTDRHQLILNNVASAMAAYPELRITVVGYTDDQGTPQANEGLSAARAQNVAEYLIGQGIGGDRLEVTGLGEQTASGSAGLASLERRVEFDVVGAAVDIGAGPFRIGVVAPSASNDLAFTQSMVEAVNLVASERNIEVSIVDSALVEADAKAAIEAFAVQGFDLVIAHGPQFGPLVVEIAPRHPEVTFAWGPAADTFGLANVYAYGAKAQEGGYVLGFMAGRLTSSGTIGIVGSLEAGDSPRFIDGFEAGAVLGRPDAAIRIDQTGSFSDIGLANSVAAGHADAGADVLTGSGQMVVGAIEVADQRQALWFGNQANQTALAPELAVAFQVYHWEVVLRPILDEVQIGRVEGRPFTIDLANGGLTIEYNEGYPLPPDLRQEADRLVGDIVAGRTVPPG